LGWYPHLPYVLCRSLARIAISQGQYWIGAKDKSVAENFAKSDPYLLNGVVTKWTVRQWNGKPTNRPCSCSAPLFTFCCSLQWLFPVHLLVQALSIGNLPNEVPSFHFTLQEYCPKFNFFFLKKKKKKGQHEHPMAHGV
jgi:hypothetical protein